MTLKTALRVLFHLVLAAATIAGIWLFVRTWQHAARPVPSIVQGQIEATEVDISAKIPGRVDTIAVREGDVVAKGDLIATLDSPEIDARLAQATAARRAASAQRDKAVHGARAEEIRAAEASWRRARGAADLAERTFQRVDRLAKDGVLPAQRRDEAETSWRTSRDAEAAARALYDLAMNGARHEDKDAAAAMVDVASGTIAEVQAYRRETRVTAPSPGEVFRRNLQPGEMVSAGLPIVTLIDLNDIWATFFIREDQLPGLGMGTEIRLDIPALGQTDAAFRISHVAASADFATWRSTSAQGGFDVKSFEVRARPLGQVAGLRPGMSVVLRGRPVAR
ncbi:MAG: efflux RND transporter periplasmic adaptor subunit [Vicinamibacterales bacterium]|nr:efflux RND transporter periplasmic adaptor subunit [Vicinamibacterales bacterium]